MGVGVECGVNDGQGLVAARSDYHNCGKGEGKKRLAEAFAEELRKEIAYGERLLGQFRRELAELEASGLLEPRKPKKG